MAVANGALLRSKSTAWRWRSLAPGRTVTWGDTISAQPMLATSRLHAIEVFSDHLSMAVQQVLRHGQQPLVVGGDHSCAVGTWRCGRRPFCARKALRADLDQCPLGCSHAGYLRHPGPAWHALGSTVGSWCAGRDRAFSVGVGKLRPEHVAIIGARSYEPAEQALLARLSVRVMYMPEVLERGFAACFAEAQAIAQSGTAGWGISFDLDGLDPRDAPGTGTPVEQGIRLADAFAVLAGCRRQAGFVAMELTEYNPLRDFGGRHRPGCYRSGVRRLGARARDYGTGSLNRR